MSTTASAPPVALDVAWLIELNAVAAAATTPETLATAALPVITAPGRPLAAARLALWYVPSRPGGSWPPDPAETAEGPPALQLLAVQGLGSAYHRLLDKFPPGAPDHPVDRAWQSGAPIVIPDPRADSAAEPDPPLPHAWQQMARRERLGAGHILPLGAGHGHPPAGVLEAYFPFSAPPDAATEGWLLLVAGTLGAAFTQLQVREALGRRLAEAAVLREVSQMISNSIDLEETLAAILTAVRRLIPYSSSEICLYDPTRRLLQTRAVAGEEGFVRHHHAEYHLGEGYTGWLADEARPLVVEDVDALAAPRPVQRDLPGGIELCSYIGLPLLLHEPHSTEGEIAHPDRTGARWVLGTLEVVFDRPHAFTANDVRLLQQVADEAAIAIERAQTYRQSRERLDRRLQELTVLQRVGRELNTSWDLERIFDLVTREAVQATGADYAGIIQLDSAGRGYLARSIYGLDPALAAQLRQTVAPLDIGLIGQVLRTGRPVLLGDVAADPAYHELLPGTRSELVIPIRYEDVTVGVINLESTRLHGFDEGAVRFVEALADQAAIAIANAQNYEAQVLQGEQLLRRAGQLSQVLEISNALTGEQPLDEILHQIAGAVVDASGFNVAVLNQIDPAHPDQLVVAAAAGLPRPLLEELRARPHPLAALQDIMHPEFRIGRAYYLPHQFEHLYAETLHAVRPMDTQREGADWHPDDLLILPLLGTTGEFLGTLSVDDPADGRRPTLQVVETLEIFANQAAIAIENAQLLDRYKQRIAEMSALNQLGGALAASLDLDAICAAVHDNTRAFIGFEAFYVALYDPARRLVSYPYAIDEGERYTLTDDVLGTGLGSLVITGAAPVLIGDLTDPVQNPRARHAPGLLPEVGEQEYFGTGRPTRTWLGVPLIVGRRVVGLITAQSYTPDAFRPEHVEFFSTAANQAAVAIENARLFQDRERRITELATLNQIARELNSSLELDQLLQGLYAQVRRILPLEFFHIALWHPERAEMEFRLNIEDGRPAPPRTESLTAGGLVAYVLNTRQPLLVKGDTNEYCLRMGIARIGIAARCWLGVPMMAGEHVLGVIILPSYTDEEAYDQDHVTLLSTIASQAAIALENAQLFQERERRIAELSILNDIARDLTSTLDVHQLLNRMLMHAQAATGAPFGTIFRYEEPRQGLRLLATAGYAEDDDMMTLGHVWDLGVGLISRVFRTGRALIVPDVSHEPDYYNADPRVRSELLVPIRKEDRVLGVLNLESTQLNAFDADHQRFVEQLAAQTAIALENARLYDEAQARILQLDTLNELSQVLSSELEPERVFETLYERVSGLFKPAAFFVGLVDREAGVINYPFLIENEQRIAGTTARLGTGLSSQVVLNGKPLVIADQTGRPESVTLAGTQDVRAWMGAPLVLGDEVIGLISVQSFDAGVYTAEHLQFLTTLAHHAAVAIQNARLFAQIREFNDQLEQLVRARTEELAETNLQLMVEKERLEELYQISHQLSTSLELDEIVHRGLQLVTAVGGVTRGSVLLLDPATGELTYRASVARPGDPMYEPRTIWPKDWGLIGWVARERQGALVADVALEPRWTPSGTWGENVRSIISVPLMAGEELLGVLTLAHPEANYFSEGHFRLVSTVANEMSIAIHNATLYEYITDQAERLAAALKVQEEEASNRKAILESITDGVMVLDAHSRMRGRVTVLNTAAERLFGVRAEDLIGLPVPRGLQDLDLHADVLALLVKIEELCRFDAPAPPVQRRFTVGARILTVTLSQVISFQEEIMGVVAVFRDVTKEVEVDRMKSEFISTVAHELRTPMTSIKGYTDLILMGSVGAISDMQRQFLTVIKNNADRLSLLVADMLDLSRIETGRIQLNRQYVAIGDLVQDVVTSLQNQFAAKNQSLHIEIAPRLPEVKLDRDRVIQVLTNLMSNANKYTPDGGAITVSARLEANALAVAVRDTGYGMAPKDLERLFTRFFRADNPAVQFVAGTGLGLVIARSLIEMHGGQIQVESELGQGSTFTCTIPLGVVDEPVLLPTPPVASTNGRGTDNLAELDNLSTMNGHDSAPEPAPVDNADTPADTPAD